MLENIQKLLLETYKNLINVEQISKKQTEISLPIFLNTGDAIDIILEQIDSETFILKNSLYSLVENSLEENINFELFRKRLSKQDKSFEKIKKEYLSNYGIGIELNQIKTLQYRNDTEFISEFFQYIFNVTRYYNYVYDEAISKVSPEKKEEIFKKEITNYIKNYNEANQRKLSLLKTDKYELVSDKNEYYSDGRTLLVGTNGKVRFLEAVSDIEIILQSTKKSKNNCSEIIIVYNELSKTDLRKTYIEKVMRAKKMGKKITIDSIRKKKVQNELF